eukprot:5078799-Prymnesium_polylepis.2
MNARAPPRGDACAPSLRFAVQRQIAMRRALCSHCDTRPLHSPPLSSPPPSLSVRGVVARPAARGSDAPRDRHDEGRLPRRLPRRRDTFRRQPRAPEAGE